MTNTYQEISFPAGLKDLSYLKSYKKNRVYFEVGSGHAIQSAKLIQAAANEVVFDLLMVTKGKEAIHVEKVELYKVETTLDRGLNISFDFPTLPEAPWKWLIEYNDMNVDIKEALLVTCIAEEIKINEVRRRAVGKSRRSKEKASQLSQGAN